MARAIAYKAGVPPSMSLALMVNAVATALRGRLVIRQPDGALEPIHRIDLVLGEPECGKNSLMRLTHGPIKEFDKAVGANTAMEGQTALSRPLLLESDKPAELIEVIEGESWATTVSLVDGGTLLASPYFRRDMQHTCILWDGDGRYSRRDTAGKLRAAIDPAVSFLGMPQAGPWQDYLEKSGPGAVYGGLLQRCSITFPAPCDIDDDSVDLAWIDAYRHLLTELLGDATAYANKMQRVPIELSGPAARIFLELHESQTRARRAGAPGPWRLLQKGLRTSLVFELLMACELRGPEHGLEQASGDAMRPAAPDAGQPATSGAPAPDGQANNWPEEPEPPGGGSSTTTGGDAAHASCTDVEAALDAIASRLSKNTVPVSKTSERRRLADLQVSERALAAAVQYTEWQHSQPGFPALQELTRVKSISTSAPRKRRLSNTERRTVQLHEDAAEVMRCVEHGLVRAREANLAGLVARPDFRETFEYVLERDIAVRVGLYALRFKRALAYLIDEGYLARHESGRRAKLSRTGRRYDYWKVAVLSGSPL